MVNRARLLGQYSGRNGDDLFRAICSCFEIKEVAEVIFLRAISSCLVIKRHRSGLDLEDTVDQAEIRNSFGIF